MRNFAFTVGLFASAVLVLTGCGSESTESSTTTSGSGTGAFMGEVNGGVLEIVLPAPATDPTVEGITEYAAAVGFAETFTFLNQSLTNQGDSVMAMCAPNIVTSSGETIALTPAMQFIGDLQDLVAQGETELYNQGVDLYNSILNTDTALPGATTTGTYITTSDVTDLDRIFSGAFTQETMGQGCDTELLR